VAIEARRSIAGQAQGTTEEQPSHGAASHERARQPIPQLSSNGPIASRWEQWWELYVLALDAIMIMIGSVHRGWHYAIDSYAGALGMCPIWWLVGRLLAGRQKRTS